MRKTTLLLALSSLLSGSLLAQKLEGNADYKAGVSALNDHLNDLAVDKLRLSLKAKNLTQKDRKQLLLVLSEAYIRSGQPALALKTLEDKILHRHPDLHYWKGIATATSGRLNDAITLLKKVQQKSTYSDEARLTLANLYHAIGDEANALSLYQSIAKGKTKISTKSALRLSELLLNANKNQKALKVINTLSKLTATEAKEKQLIKAKIKLSEKDYNSAIKSLTDLLKNRKHLSKRALNSAILTLADAYYLNGDTNAALDEIFTFIEKNQESPILNELFSRIDQWIPPASTKINNSKIEQLRQWAGRNTPDTTKLDNQEAVAIPINENDFTALAHYFYARFLSKSEDPAKLLQALLEFNLLRMNQPTHRTAGMSLMDTAEIQLQLEKNDEAIATLTTLQNTKLVISPLARQQAAFIQGELLAKTKNFKAAAKAFQIASQANNKALSQAATINTGLAYLETSNQQKFTSFLEKSDSLELKQQLTLERALWASKNKPLEARTMLQEFIQKHPKDLRITEAQLALAENTIRISPTNLQTCERLINKLSAKKLKPEQFAIFANIKYLYATSRQDYPAAIATATQFLKTGHSPERKLEFQLLLGEAYYRDGQHNPARNTLLQLVTAHPDSPLADYALYYASLAARHEGTPQSKKESISWFKKLIARKSPITTEATLQLADLYIDTNQPDSAQKLLLAIYKPAEESHLQRQIAIKLAAALHALSEKDPKLYPETIKIYDQLLTQKKLSQSWFNRIHFNKGATYEKMEENQKAVNTYYNVINVDPAKTPITEWVYYYRCGFNAVSMLRKFGNPKAAISIAKKLASTEGPRAEEAAKLAREMEMQYMIWDE